jgi:hypothetical protein
VDVAQLEVRATSLPLRSASSPTPQSRGTGVTRSSHAAVDVDFLSCDVRRVRGGEKRHCACVTSQRLGDVICCRL